MNTETCLKEARQAVENYLQDHSMPKPDPAEPGEAVAVFVTLTKNDTLRGCIGCLEPELPLMNAVRKYAVMAAFRDPRFPEVSEKELPQIRFGISVLSPLSKVDSAGEIIPGKHGVEVQQGRRGGVYLPQVWEHFNRKEDFLSELCRTKAGLAPDAWNDPETELFVFTVDKMQEQ